MFSIVKCALFFTLVASVFSLGIPQARSVHKRHALAVRAPVEVLEPEAMRPWSAPRKRAVRRRCASNTSSSALPGASTATPTASTTTDSSTPSSEAPPVVDAGADPKAAPAPAPSPSPSPSPAPSPSPSPSPADTPAPAAAPAPASTPAPAPAPSSGGSAGRSGSGQITFYDTGLGACGIVNSNTDFIAAVAIPMFDNFPGADGNPNHNPICGKQVKLTHGQNTVIVTIEDRCEACKDGDFDLSPSAFNALADPSVGRTDMTFTFLD